MINYRDHVLELADEGYMTDRELLVAALKYMSNSDIADMIVSNELPPKPLDENWL